MRNVLAFVAALVLTVVGVGWYLGWYRVSSPPSGEGRHNVNFEFNTIKIEEDLNRGGEKVQKLIERARKDRGAGQPAGAQEPSEPAPPGPPR